MTPKMRSPITSWKDLEPFRSKIFTEMFKRVNADIKSFDFSPDNWYEAYYWDEKTESEFKDWLVKVVIKKYGLTEKAAINEAAYFILGWGWTSSEERCNKFRSDYKFVPKPFQYWYTPLLNFLKKLMFWR